VSVVEDPSYDRWVSAYGDVYEALPGRPPISCPRCGVDALRVAFVGDVGERRGYAAFWCGNCGFGIHLSLVDVPPGVAMHPFGLEPDELEKIIPEYTMIVPPSDEELGEVLAF
jgi:hypothetical protein